METLDLIILKLHHSPFDHIKRYNKRKPKKTRWFKIAIHIDTNKVNLV